MLANDYGIFAHTELLLRFGNMYRCQWWDGSMIGWGLDGCGPGPRHAALSHVFGAGHLMNFEARPPGDYVPNRMPAILEAIEQGRQRAWRPASTRRPPIFVSHWMPEQVRHDGIEDTVRGYSRQ